MDNPTTATELVFGLQYVEDHDLVNDDIVGCAAGAKADVPSDLLDA